jgi:hypothetical protein
VDGLMVLLKNEVLFVDWRDDLERGIMGVEERVEVVGSGGAEKSSRVQDLGNGEGLTDVIFGEILDFARFDIKLVNGLKGLVD